MKNKKEFPVWLFSIRKSKIEKLRECRKLIPRGIASKFIENFEKAKARSKMKKLFNSTVN